MKTFYKSMMLVAAAAMAFVSCQKEIENPEIDNAPKMKTIKVSTDIATRTSLDSNHENIVWSTGDEISIFNNANNNNSELTYAADGYIEVEVPEATTEIYAHYPYYSGNTSGPESVSIYIAKNQTQTNPGELNGYYYPMVAKGTVSADNKALISLYPVAGALALNLYHTGLSGSESVSSVKVTVSNTGIVGSQSTDITADNVQYTAPATDGPVTVTLTNPLALGNSKPTDTQAFDGQIYVCLAKQSYSEVTFEITTDKGTYTITSNSTAFDLENNDFVPVNINLAKAAKEVAPTVFTVGTEIATIFPSVKNGIKFEYAQGEGTIAPAYYSPFRWQNNSTVTISAGTTPIEKVVFSSAATTVTADSGTYSEGTWTASDDETTSVTFTNTGNQITFKSIEVYTDESGTETVVTSTPSLTIESSAEIPAGASKSLAASTNYNNATIVYASDNTSVATVDSDGEVSAIAQGTATITASIAGVTTDFYVIESVSASCAVTVTASADYDILNYSFTGLSSSGYQTWSNKAGNYSSAVYAGNSNGGVSYIQIRQSTPSGIVSTTSGGSLKKVAVDWATATSNTSGRVLTIYGSYRPFTSSADLYDSTFPKTSLGTIVYGTSTELEVSGAYEYVGIASNGAAYLDEIDIWWDEIGTRLDPPTDVAAAVSGTTINVTWTDAANADSYLVTCTGQAPVTVLSGVQAASFSNLDNGTYEITVQAIANSSDNAASSIVTVSDLTISSGSTEYYEKVTEITGGGTYLIVANSYALAHPTGSATIAGTAVTVSNNKIERTSATQSLEFIIDKCSVENYTDYYTIAFDNSGTTNYLYAVASNGTKFNKTTNPVYNNSATGCWTFSSQAGYAGGSFLVTNVAYSSSNRAILLNGTTFGFYATSNTGYYAIDLYKLSEN